MVKVNTVKGISNEALLAHIRAIHAEVKQEYGGPKMWKNLVACGHRVGEERVRRLMQLYDIKARGKRKFCRHHGQQPMGIAKADLFIQ